MTTAQENFSRRVEGLDLSLFKTVPTQSGPEDRRSWLAVQRAVRRGGEYVYLEIGSHLGGSIQQHLVDPLCRRIISIDKRPEIQPDDRGEECKYPGNSTGRMMDWLGKVTPQGLERIVALDSDAKDVDPNMIPQRPQLCFIDGEHTRAAVLSDFEFCLTVCDPNAIICFHDDNVIHPALREITRSLKRRGLDFTARKLPGLTFAIFLKQCPAAKDEFLSGCRDGLSWLRGRRQRQVVKAAVKPFIPDWLAPMGQRVARRFL